jgi:hypothetical protein
MDLHSSDAGAFLLPWPHVGVKFTWPTAMHAHNMNTANNKKVRMVVMEVVATVYNNIIIVILFAVTVERFANGCATIYIVCTILYAAGGAEVFGKGFWTLTRTIY